MRQNFDFGSTEKEDSLWQIVVVYVDAKRNRLTIFLFIMERKKFVGFVVLYVWCFWMLLNTMKEILSSWHRSFMRKKGENLGELLLMLYFWAFWQEHNFITFEGVKCSEQSLEVFSFYTILWCC